MVHALLDSISSHKFEDKHVQKSRDFWISPLLFSLECSVQNFKQTFFVLSTTKVKIIICISVSHTTDDLIFVWLPEDKVPLAVDSGIELPQLELVSNDTGDCTSVYSTGIPTIFCWFSCTISELPDVTLHKGPKVFQKCHKRQCFVEKKMSGSTEVRFMA